MIMRWDEILGYGSAGGLAAGPIGIAAGVGTGLLGSILSSNSQSSANKYNLQAVRETNAANQAINDANLAASREAQLLNFQEAARGRAFEAQQSDIARQFNAREAQLARNFQSPREQARLKLAGGLNPLADVGGSSAAMASGSPMPSAPIGGSGTVPASIPMQAGLVSPVSNQLALVGQILKDVSLADKVSRDTRRGQDYQKEVGMEQAAASHVAAAAAKRAAESGADVAEKQMALYDAQLTYQKLVNDAFPERLAAELRLSDAQATNLVESVKAQFAGVDATLRSIQAQLDINHNNIASAWNMHGDDLEMQAKMFEETMKLKAKEFGLTEQQVRQAMELASKEFAANYGGLNHLWNWLGIHPDGVISALAQLYLGKQIGKNAKKLGTKQTSSQTYKFRDGTSTVTYEKYYP